MKKLTFDKKIAYRKLNAIFFNLESFNYSVKQSISGHVS